MNLRGWYLYTYLKLYHAQTHRLTYPIAYVHTFLDTKSDFPERNNQFKSTVTKFTIESLQPVLVKSDRYTFFICFN